MRIAAIIAWIVLAVLLGLAPAAAEKRVALIIGNGAYQHVPRLTNPRKDAELIAETLKSLGFTLIGDRALVDLDKTGFDNAVQNFGAQLQGADVGLFYYAGHGVQVRGANYLVPVGANPTKEADVDFQMLDTNLVLRQMEGSGTKLNVVILDACRNNPFGGRGLRATGNGLAQMQAPEGTLISYATQPGNVAGDGTDGNSPYTKALAQIMRRPGLGIFDAFNQVGLAVKNATGGSQQPWVSSSPISGTFFFVAPPAVLTPPSAGAHPPPSTAALTPPSTAALTPPSTAVIFNESNVRALAAKQGVPLPQTMRVVAPSSAVPKMAVEYLGAWGGNQRWGGEGRQMILLVTNIDDSGTAIGVYAYGPPNSKSFNQDPASYWLFTGTITDNGLKFENQKANWKFTFKIRPDGIMKGQSDGPKNTHPTIAIERIN